MQNQEIIKIIENLKGRKNYVQKRATKLGFSSLYTYFEDKISKQKKVAVANYKGNVEVIKNNKIIKNKKTCSCC